MKSKIPQVFYGLHMVEGVAEYKKSPTDSYRMLILENAIKRMDPTFAGRPVYVGHVDNVDYDNLKNADGYVVESFYNKSDGKHWAKFIVVTEKGKEAIRNGCSLSNAYAVKNKNGGGKWHNVDYAYEVSEGEYDHLALVPDPRYQESVILTPDQFKAYNHNKETELLKLANSKDKEIKPMFNLFTKQKSEVDTSNLTVKLPKSGREVEFSKLVNEADEAELKKENEIPAPVEEKKENTPAPVAEPVMANGDHMVECGGTKMSVNELVEKYNTLTAPPKADDEKKKENEAPVAEEKKEETPVEDKKTNAAHFEQLKNAEETFKNSKAVTIQLPVHQVARGKSRYGSK